MSPTVERQAACTISELDLHLRYVQKDLEKIVAAISNMATREDINRLSDKMASFATKDELNALEARLQAGNVRNTFYRVLEITTKLGTALAVVVTVVGLFYAFVKFIDRVPIR